MSIATLPQVDLGHSTKLGQKYRSKINRVPQVPRVPQRIRACVRARVTSDERDRPMYCQFYLGQLGHLGQSIEIASLFCAPSCPPKSVNLGHLGHSGRTRVRHGGGAEVSADGWAAAGNDGAAA